MTQKPDQSLILIAHNIRSLHNVGSLFRTADGAGVDKLYLTGFSGHPPRDQISKTALGAEDMVDWEHQWEIETVVDRLLEEGYALAAVEKHEDSIPYHEAESPEKLALILGNEVWGLEPEVLEKCHQHIHVPMWGGKISLNVAVCGGVILYGMREVYRKHLHGVRNAL